MRRVGVGVVDDDVENVDDEHDDRLHLLPVATRLLRDDEANAEDDEASADAIRDMMKIIITTTTTTTTTTGSGGGGGGGGDNLLCVCVFWRSVLSFVAFLSISFFFFKAF